MSNTQRFGFSRHLWLLISFLAVCPAAVFSQGATTPDFSGTWKLNLAASKIAKSGTAPLQLIITCTGETIQTHTSAKPGGVTRTYIVDGKEHVQESIHTPSKTIVTYTKAAWDGSTLVIEVRSHLEDPETPTIQQPDFEGSERWSVSGEGHILTQAMDLPGVSKDTLVYDKQ